MFPKSDNPISKLRLLAFLLLIAFQNIYSDEPRVIKVGTDDHYPVLFKAPDGKATGLYVDLLTEVGRMDNLQFEYIFLTWDEALNRLKTGEVDLMAGVAFSEARATYMDYCKNPLLTVWGELYALPSSDIDSIFKISGKKIGVIRGDINTSSFKDLTSKFAIECLFVELAGYDDVFKAIADKKVDAGIAGITFGAPKRGEYGLKATGIVFNPYDLYFTVTKSKQTDLLTTLDSRLDAWKHQGESVFTAAKGKWMYGSVGTVEVIPRWLTNALMLALIIVAIALAFIVLLRAQVKRATSKIRQRETTLRESESKLRTMVETFPLAVIMMSGIEQTTQYLNSTMIKLLGYTKEDLPTIDRWWALAYPDEHYRNQISTEWASKVKQAIASGMPMETMETFVTTKHGIKKYISWGYMPMGNEGYSFGLDLTERKAAEEKLKRVLAEKELLLIEVHHRIKNNMNTIKGLLTLQSSTETEPSVVSSLREAEGRIQSIIMLYDRLYCTDNYRELSVKTYFESLVAEIVGGYQNSNSITIKTKIPDTILNIQILTPLGIIVNELLTNIMKHAFAGRERGSIAFQASFLESKGTIIVHDDGIGMPEPVMSAQSSGFGLRLITMLIEQLDGTIRSEHKNGTKVTIEFKI